MDNFSIESVKLAHTYIGNEFLKFSCVKITSEASDRVSSVNENQMISGD